MITITAIHATSRQTLVAIQTIPPSTVRMGASIPEVLRLGALGRFWYTRHCISFLL
jgi:hypothetical protein